MDMDNALALAETHAAMGLDSEAFTIYAELVDELLGSDRTKDALVLVDEMIALEPLDPAGHLIAAECHARLGDIDATVASAGHAVPLYLQRGSIDEALELLEQIISYWPDPACALAAARIHLERGGQSDGVAALRKLQVCFKANPEDLDILVLLARAFDAIGQPDKADRVLEEAAGVAERRGDDDAFEKLVNLLLSRDPKNGAARELSAKLHRRHGDGAAPLAEVASLDPSMLWLEDEITDALMRRPSQPPASVDEDVLWRADTLAAAGRFDEARTHLDAVGHDEHPLVQDVRERLERLELASSVDHPTRAPSSRPAPLWSDVAPIRSAAELDEIPAVAERGGRRRAALCGLVTRRCGYRAR